MAEINLRDEKQKEVSQLWLDSNRINTLVLGTGFGKSKVTMLILECLFNTEVLTKNSKILLLGDSEKLRDTNWKNDFGKWGLTWMWNLIRAECYQTVYRWEDTSWDIVIADEIDFSLSPEYSKFYENNSYTMLLGLTGFVDPSKDALLESIAPILTRYSTQDAQADGILNSTQVVFVEFDLNSVDKTKKVEYTSNGEKKSFNQTENDAYSYIENKCNVLMGKVDRLEEDPGVVFGTALDKLAELKQLKYQLDRARAARKELLFYSDTSANKAKLLINKVLENPLNKVLVFSSYTVQSDKISDFTYNGKNKKLNTGLEDLSSGKIRQLGVCDAVNRSVNLVGVNNLVIETFDGSKTKFNQRHGRGTRLLPTQKMYLYIMLPYYYKEINSTDVVGGKVKVRRPTQMVKWAENMIEGFNLINPLTIKL